MVLASLSNHISQHFPPSLYSSHNGLLLYQAFAVVSVALWKIHSPWPHIFIWATHSHASHPCSDITFTRSLSQPCYLRIKMSHPLFLITSFSQCSPLLSLFVCLVYEQMKTESSFIPLFPSLLCLIYQLATSVSKMHPANVH